jgi:hypothetical protein
MTETLDYGDHDEDDTTRKSSRSRQRRVASRVCTRSRSVGSLRTLSPRSPAASLASADTPHAALPSKRVKAETSERDQHHRPSRPWGAIRASSCSR